MKKLIPVFLFIIIILSNVFATQETILTVSQPILAENGLTESICTYAVFLNYSIVSKMTLTCAENCVLSHGEHDNRNMSNLFGFQIKFSRSKHDMYINFGDTIKVDLVIPKKKIDSLPKKFDGVTMDQAIKATIICLFKNATSYDFINLLDLKIIGNSEYKKYSKIYTQENIFSFKDL